MNVWLLVFGIPLAAFVLAGVDMWRMRRRHAKQPCTRYSRCEECQ